MSVSVRLMIAVIAGLVVTTVLAYLGAVAFILARMGIPLGSEGRPPTAAEYLCLLVIAVLAAAIGGHISSGMLPHRSRFIAAAQAAILTAGALWGFLRPASHWPGWWAPALAAALAAGTWLGGDRLCGSRDSRTG